MSLQDAAKLLASHGRGKDSQLVHMTPREVKSLQDLAKLHGGSLTTNPHTGLPEAGFLDAALPMVAGFALDAAVPGLGEAMGGFAIPAMVGGASYLTSGSLTKGLMAGMGAYGGQSLAAGLGGVGTSAYGADTAAAEDAQAAKMQEQAIAQKEAEIQAARTNPAMWDDSAPQAAPSRYTQAQLDYMRGQDTTDYLAGQTAPSQADKISRGVEEVAKTPSKLKDVGGGTWGGLAKMGAMAAAPAVPSLLQPKGLDMAQIPKSSSSPNPVYRYEAGKLRPTPTPSPYGIEQDYFPTAQYVRTAADGGMMTEDGDTQGDPNLMDVKTFDPVVRMAGGGMFSPIEELLSQLGYFGNGSSNTPTTKYNYNPDDQEYTQLAGGGTSISDKYRSKLDDNIQSDYQKAQDKNDQSTMRSLEKEQDIRNATYAAMNKGLSGVKGLYASGGLSDLGGYSDGGRLLRGPGDGVSDSIPAVIGRKQPARLADGEFVVPARIVSEIGNGSTEAGARKLYAMMDRVQKARSKTTGKGKIATNTKADRYLPV